MASRDDPFSSWGGQRMNNYKTNNNERKTPPRKSSSVVVTTAPARVTAPASVAAAAARPEPFLARSAHGVPSGAEPEETAWRATRWVRLGRSVLKKTLRVLFLDDGFVFVFFLFLGNALRP